MPRRTLAGPHRQDDCYGTEFQICVAPFSCSVVRVRRARGDLFRAWLLADVRTTAFSLQRLRHRPSTSGTLAGRLRRVSSTRKRRRRSTSDRYCTFGDFCLCPRLPLALQSVSRGTTARDCSPLEISSRRILRLRDERPAADGTPVPKCAQWPWRQPSASQFARRSPAGYARLSADIPVGWGGSPTFALRSQAKVGLPP